MENKVLPKTTILSPLFCFSKKRLFEEIAQCAGYILEQDTNDVVQALNDREKYGSTVFFQGIAIPHAVVHTDKPSFAVLSILDEPISYNPIGADTQMIDIAYAIFISDKENYEDVQLLLKNITIILSNQDLLNSLRLAKNEKVKIDIIIKQIDDLLEENYHSLTSSENTDDEILAEG